MAFKIEVWGDYALFSRPELKVERMSYDVMTPSAARGLLESIYWHPGLRFKILKIYVMNPIQFSSVRRNEIRSKTSWQRVKETMAGKQGELYISTPEDIQQRAATVLRNVHYVIEARFEMTDKANETDNPGKFCDILRRRLERGQCYHQPCFGVREFPANFQLWSGGEIPTAYTGTKDLGLMLYDMDYGDPEHITPMFFRAKLENGILNVPTPDSGEVLR